MGILIAILCVGILCYSQIPILEWDEGFHLLAASLIAASKRPYLDFLFPQPWLHAAWNALWLTLTGGGWRGPHFIAALETCAAILLVFRISRTAALMVALNPLVVIFGTTAQAYGACLLLTVGAYTALTANRNIVAGVCAGLSASCSLLSAPVAPVLVGYFAVQRRWRDAAKCAAGVAIGLAPILFALLRAPAVVWFNLVEYHAVYRRAGWTDVTAADLDVLKSPFHSWQALVLLSFAVIGLRRAPLAAVIAAALAIEAAVAHPTFAQYFAFTIPFLAIVASPPRATVIPLTALLAITCATSLLDARHRNNTWTAMETIAQKIVEVTPPDGLVFADPPVYFAMHRQPPSGMEFPASHDIDFPRYRAAALHILPWRELDRRVRLHDFAAAETCKGDEEEIAGLELRKLYRQHTRIAGCDVYWQPALASDVQH